MNKKLILFMTSLALAMTPVSAVASEYTEPQVSIESVGERAQLRAANGSYKSWLQYDAAWRNLTLGVGGDTMADSGCLVTSIAILMVHSGATDENGVDPGKLCTYLTNNGGFNSYSELIWGKVSGAVEGFKLANWGIGLSGTRAQKVEQIRRYLNMGYYIVLSVGHGGHWVAVDSVDANGNVYIFDPAYSVTNLFDFWSVDGVDSMATFTSTGKGNGSISGGSTSVTDYDATGRVNVGASYLNVRSGVGTGTDYLKDASGSRITLKNREEVVITGKAKDSSGATWYRVFIDGAVGYVYAAYVDVLSASEMVTGEGKLATVTGSLVNIRKGVGQAYASVGTAPLNAKIQVYESKTDSQGNTWYKVKYGNTVGYMIAEYVQLDESAGNTSSSETIYSEAKSGKVNVELLNMRKGAAYTAAVQYELPLNTKVSVLGETKDSSGTKWYKIKCNGSEGYVVAEYVTITEDDTTAGDYTDSKNGVVNGNYVYVRTGAGTNHSYKTSLMKNTAVTIVGEAKDSSGTVWYKIKYSGGEGYMRHDFIDIKENSGNNNTNTNGSYAEKKAKVNQDSVNVRSGAGTNNSIVGNLAKNTAVTVVNEAKDSSGTVWYKIKYSGGEGYMRHDFITLDSTGSNNNNNTNNGTYTEKAGKVNGNGVNVRTGAGTSHPSITSLSTGASVTIVGEAKDGSGATWYKIKYSGGEGYMHSSYVTISTGSTSSGTTPTPTPTPSYTSKNGVVNGNYVAVRTGAGTSNTKKTSLMKNAAVTIIGETKDSDGDLWYKVQYSGGEGYIYSAYVDIKTSTGSGNSSSSNTGSSNSGSSSSGNSGNSGSSNVNVPIDGVAGKEGVVNQPLVYVRSSASSSASEVDTLEKDSEIFIESATKDSNGIVWYKISYAGTKGYMMGQYITVK